MTRVRCMCFLLVCVAVVPTAEARGRRMYQQAYTPYYYPTNVVQPAQVVQQPTAVVNNGAVIQTNATATTATTTTTNTVVQAGTLSVPTECPPAGTAAVGSAQWKAEQSARIGSVQHLGGGFGGGSFEGNGYGFSPQQAVTNACYWGQRTPIEIGVARGANGYYATIFYR